MASARSLSLQAALCRSARRICRAGAKQIAPPVGLTWSASLAITAAENDRTRPMSGAARSFSPRAGAIRRHDDAGIVQASFQECATTSDVPDPRLCALKIPVGLNAQHRPMHEITGKHRWLHAEALAECGPMRCRSPQDFSGLPGERNFCGSETGSSGKPERAGFLGGRHPTMSRHLALQPARSSCYWFRKRIAPIAIEASTAEAAPVRCRTPMR